MSELIEGVKIFGGDERIPALTRQVRDGDTFNVCVHSPFDEMKRK
jgi:hypothetical protein